MKTDKTTERSTNMLAELAERLGGIKTPPTFYLTRDDYNRANDDLAKATRIIAELAKPDRVDGRIALEIMMNCRAIAEEGAGDGK